MAAYPPPPFLPPGGYHPPHYGSYPSSGYAPPQVNYSQPWTHPNTPYYPQLPQPPQFNGPQLPLPHWQPPRRGGQSWRGGRGGSQRPGRNTSTSSFECKPCNKQYKSEGTYNTHIQSHVKCTSCAFEGSGKALKDHELMHILPDELKFTSDEDIHKWREQRKRKFPTFENVARKRQLEADKSERGESAVTPLHKYIQHLIGEDKHSRGRRGGRGSRRGRGRPFNQRGNQKQLLESRQDAGNVSQVEKNGDDTETQENIIGAILADCNADVDEGDSPSPKKKCREGPQKEKWTSRRQKKRIKASSTGLQGVCSSRKPTLLEKLLAPEICHEENTLLQCIRHITLSNFFTAQVPSEPIASSAESSIAQNSL